MKRVPDPEIRKRQILEKAMELFYEKGYENTSLDDIARELNVVKSLCYRYYDSKQTLFAAVLSEYTQECCSELIKILKDRQRGLGDRLEAVLRMLITPAEAGRYHDFFHKEGNESMHDQLAVRMCRLMMPDMVAEVDYFLRSGDDAAADDPKTQALAHFLLYGMIGVWLESGEDAEGEVQEFRKTVDTALSAAR